MIARQALVILLVLSTVAACDLVQPAAVTAPSPAVAVVVAEPQPSAGPASAPLAKGTLPDRNLTPGEVFAGITASAVCVSGYAGRARKVLREQYVQVYAGYGIPYPEPAGTYELDHLVPLELGGDNANRNLWPEASLPVPGFHQKDELENYLHDAVCAGRMQLADAQAAIAGNWLDLYHRYLQP
jgi:hypothetical protein